MSEHINGPWAGDGRLPAAFTTPGSSSFSAFLAEHAADLLPGRRPLPQGEVPASPHATTIVALTYAGGVIMAGDRRATMGNVIAHREMDKVFAADAYSCVGIAGTAGVAVEMVRLFQVELEHYEKIEGALMSLDGKANRLATMVRGNLGMAMQGLAAVPLFAGYDIDRELGRIFSYDITGGRYEERELHSIGSGSVYAKGVLKRGWRSDLNESQATDIALEALIEAADEDSATGGPDERRGIYPLVAVIDGSGFRYLDAESLASRVTPLLNARQGRQS